VNGVDQERAAVSGPKGGGYSVETAAQREARLLREAKAQYALAESAWNAVISRIAALAAVTGTALSVQRPPAVPADADSTTYTAATGRLQAATTSTAAAAAQAREEAARIAHDEQVARIAARLAAEPEPADGAVAPSRWQAGRPAAVPTDEPPAETIDWARVQDRVKRRLAALADLDHPVAAVEGLLADVAAATGQSRIDLLIGELDHIINQARAAAERRAAIETARGELSALHAKVADLAGDEVDALRRRINELITAQAAEVPADLVADVNAGIERADAEADRRHVVAALHHALDELGYVAGPEFSTDLAGPKGAAFARKTSSNYGVKLRLEPGSARFSAQAVKSDAVLTTTAEDLAAEEKFCETFDKLVELAKRDGVELDVDIRTPPGATGVQQVSDAALAKTTAAAVRRATHTRTRQSR